MSPPFALDCPRSTYRLQDSWTPLRAAYIAPSQRGTTRGTDPASLPLGTAIGRDKSNTLDM